MVDENESKKEPSVYALFLEIRGDSESQIERCVRGLYVPRNFVVFRMYDDYEVRLDPMQVRNFGNNFMNHNGLDLGRFSPYFQTSLEVKTFELTIGESAIKGVINWCSIGRLNDARNQVKYIYQGAEAYVQQFTREQRE